MNDFNYKKSLGQNFLQDKNILENIVKCANICDNSLTIEIGPGSGNLTICIFATLIMLFVLVSLRRVERVASKHNPMIIIVCSPNQPILKEVLQVANRFSINIKDTESQLINYQNEQYIRVSIRIAPARESAINELIDELKLTQRPLDIKISTEF